MTTLALAAARSRTALVAGLLALAVVAWSVTALEMRDMADRPWTNLGTPGGFIGIWLAMMAAMMLPSVWPTVALYSRMGDTRSATGPLFFTTAYLALWVGFGALAFALVAASRDVLAWNRAGRWLAGATLLFAAAYELTPPKRACLDRCRSPFHSLWDSWQTGTRGALELGLRHAMSCIGCCWALMASLFALGAMSLVWMAVIAAVIAVQKLLARLRVATFATVALLSMLAVMVLAAPDALPAVKVPAAM